jgi:hypothetical protein
VNLFAAELRRFGLRRAMRWMCVAALAVIALAMVITAAQSKVKNLDAPSMQCKLLPGPTDAQGNAGAPVEQCTPFGTPLTHDDRIHYDRHLADAIGGSGVALMLLSVLFGATFIGADYVSGSLGGQLTFEPRRVRVYVTKALAVFAATTVVTAVLLVVISGGLAVVAATRGVVGDLDASWWAHRAADVARVAALCGGAGALAFGVTTVTRRTVAAVVGFLALGFILEPALTASLDMFDGRTPVLALVAVAVNDFTNTENIPTSLGRAVLVSAVWAAVLLGIGGALFARREIR